MRILVIVLDALTYSDDLDDHCRGVQLVLEHG